MILLEVDAKSIGTLELERDAPGSIDVDGIARRLEAAERMEVETRKIHFLGLLDRLQPVQPPENALMHARVDLRRTAFLPQVGQSFVSEASDHIDSVSKPLTYVNRSLTSHVFRSDRMPPAIAMVIAGVARAQHAV